jgi:hypothetical protein
MHACPREDRVCPREEELCDRGLVGKACGRQSCRVDAIYYLMRRNEVGIPGGTFPSDSNNGVDSPGPILLGRMTWCLWLGLAW